MKLTIKIGGETRFQRIYHHPAHMPEVTPEVTVDQSQNVSISLPSLIDKGVVGNIQSFQCTVCEALLRAPAVFKNKSMTKQVVCGICGSKLQAPAAPPSAGTWSCYPSSVLVAAAINRTEALKLENEQLKLENEQLKLENEQLKAQVSSAEVEQPKAQLPSVEVFDVDSNQTEQVARTDVEPAPKRHKGTFTEKLQTKLNEWTLMSD